MAEYGIKTVPDGMPVGAEESDRIQPTVAGSIADAMAKMSAMAADAFGLGSTLGQQMPVPGPVSEAGNSPVLDSDGDYDYDKSPDLPGEDAAEHADHSGAAVQNG